MTTTPSKLFNILRKHRKIVVPASITYMVLVAGYVFTAQTADAQFQVPANAGGITYTNEDLELLAQTMTCEYPQAIVSESMEPELKVGETVIVDYCFPISELEVGDIIVFKADWIDQFENNKVYQYNVDLGIDAMLIMHRVIDIDEYEDGSITMTTKGDNNDAVIKGAEDDIDTQQYLGKVIREIEQ